MNKNAFEADSFCCPTCGAQQVPAVECRRCKCDLALVVNVRDQAAAIHQACLRHLQTADYGLALDCAVLRLQLSPDETARRLLAIAYLHLGRYQAAVEVIDVSEQRGR